jgi:DNA-binding NtrC family response regulator
MKHILVVDDERGTRESVKMIFAGTHEVTAAASAEEGLKTLGAKRADAVLLDVLMPGKDGIAFLKEVHSLYPEIPVIMISACTSLRPVVDAMREGAYDYVQKPFDVEDLRRLVARALESTTLRQRVSSLESEVAIEFPVSEIVGESPDFLQALNDARKAAATDSTVLITGESGTGKELVARRIHSLSARRDEPFVAVHCGSLPETLMESELFGHEKGAFTGADRLKPGRFDLAGSGTLFFDEAGEMTPATQVRLLRVLQEKEFVRVGGTRVIRTNARILAATARDLRQDASAGRFREDLFYRLSVVPVLLPPLRARRDDIPRLASELLSRLRRTLSATTEAIEPAAMDAFCQYGWPGNVRELKNIIERMLVLHGRDRVLRLEYLPDEFRQAGARTQGGAASTPLNGKYQESVDACERRMIEDALRQSGGVQTRAATLLGITRRILRYRMTKLGITKASDSTP